MKFTIFTPTYNRAHTLPRLYKSLLEQDYADFEWLIVDDGSSDNTESLINEYIAEQKINVRYIYQENGGKHRAINRGLKEAKGEYFMVLDSDDYLVSEGMKILSRLSDKISEKENFAGFTTIHFSEKWEIDFSKYGKKEWTKDGNYNWEYIGEMGFCYKTEIMRKFPFPEFENEKFCPESVVHRRIRRAGYKILYTDNIVMRGDYLEGGLTHQYYSLMVNSPRYALLSYKEKMWDFADDEKEKQILVKYYWDIALKAKHIPLFEKLKGIPLRYTILFFLGKLYKRLKN